MVTFLVQLQVLDKDTPMQMLSCQICEVYRSSLLLLQKTEGRLLLILSKKFIVSLALLAINQFHQICFRLAEVAARSDS